MVGFLFPALQVSTWEPGCRSVDLFPPDSNGGFHLRRYSGMLLGRLLRPVVSPRCKCLGAGLPGLLGSCFWSYCFRQVQAVAASAAPPVLFILRLPGFPQKLRLRGY